MSATSNKQDPIKPAVTDEDVSSAISTQTAPPRLSTLPWGPLEGAFLFLKVADMAQLLRVSKHFSTLQSDDLWREMCCDIFGRHLSFVENIGKDAMRAMLDARKMLPCYSSQLFSSCEGASTQDQAEEGPANTMEMSLCGGQIAKALTMDGRPIPVSLGQSLQAVCECWGQGKCYWSSAPSAVPNKDEWIVYTLAAGVTVISAFEVTPYTSFWQPEAPTYHPVEACIQLYNPDVGEGEPYYTSPRFRVQGIMTPQRFELPKPIVTLGGKAKLLLLGMAQRQTLEKEEVGETANHYYVCLSYVALRGAQVPGVSLALGGGSDPAKPLRISCNTQARSNPTRSRKEQGKVKPLWINDESSFWLRRILQRISSLLSGLKCITLLCLRIHHNRLLRRF